MLKTRNLIDNGYADLALQIVYIPVVGLAIYACLVGLGRLNEDLNAWQQSESIKYYIIWILLYVVALATVKSSVCITIRRIASIQKPMKITVWCLLAVTWASFLVTFIGTLTYCTPVQTICKSPATYLHDIRLICTQGPLPWPLAARAHAQLRKFSSLLHTQRLSPPS